MMTTTSAQAPSTPIKTFQVDALPVRVYNQQAELARDAAGMAHRILRDRLASQGAAAVILATGNSQITFLEALIALGGIEWSRLTLFHMDEYLGIDPNHKASFRRYMRERVEQRVKPGTFHYLEGDAMQPLDECERYARLLQAQPIDLCCLGIGENGHIAFNDPPVANFEDPHKVKIVKLDLACRQQQVGEGHFPGLEAVPQYALTLTIPMLCSARNMLCVAPEKRKANAVKDALRGSISTACPASLLRRQSHAILFLDEESASLL
jgi:glucosamine-6-phosphate deaminase